MNNLQGVAENFYSNEGETRPRMNTEGDRVGRRMRYEV